MAGRRQWSYEYPRPAVTVDVALFTVASVFSGMSHGATELVVGRFVQGLGGSLSGGVIVAIAESVWLDFRLALMPTRVVGSAAPPTEATLIDCKRDRSDGSATHSRARGASRSVKT